MTLVSTAAWNEAWARYTKALAAENAYDEQHIDLSFRDLPLGPERSAAIDAIPAAVWEGGEPFANARHDAEDVLFNMPSPDLRGFAQKVIICRAEQRDLNGLDDHLVEEARRLLAEPATQDQHPIWLADRNRLWTIVNQWAPMAEGLMDALCEIVATLEKRIAETPATTPMGWIAKAAVLLQLPSEGFEPSAELCDAAMLEAQHLFGIAATQSPEVTA